ncbi:MAG: CpsB/CapC family capsule biosynthesis tyrosine phosphatase, partial [Coprococcus sp.]
MEIIDFHSHILPGIDDGSRNVETSIKMLDRCADNGVGLMVATPHF